MRYKQASDLINALNDSTGEPVPFAWRKAWLARQDSLIAAALNPAHRLRTIPGLRYPRLLGLAVSRHKHEPVMLRTAADAIQVSEDGHRLRSFHTGSQTTEKLVRTDSRYGAGTRHEIPLRTGPLAKFGLSVPRLDHYEARGDFLYLREEMISGRLFNATRDRALFVPRIVEPLADFYRQYGLTQKPLTDILGADLTSFILRQEDTQTLHPLIERNPLVAVSLCHNDLKASNLAVSKKSVYFLDWERADPYLCGRDFVMIGVKYKDDTKIAGPVDGLIRALHEDRLNLADILALYKAEALYKKARPA